MPFLLLQTFPITSQNVDKLLSLDPLSMGLIIGVVIVLTLLVTSWYQGRSNSASDMQQTAIIKFFTDEKSPMVTSNNRVAAAIEQQTKVLSTLGDKTDKQTSVFEANIVEQKNFSSLVTKDLSVQTESMVDMRKSFEELRAEVRSDMNAIDRKLDQLIQDKADCMKLREQLEAFKGHFNDKLTEQNKRDTSTQTVVNVMPFTPDTAPAPEADSGQAA